MTNEIKRLNSNPRMSQVVISNGYVHLSGQVPESTNASVTDQATEILTRIESLLASAGVDKTRLISANIWLTDPKHFAEFNAVWDAWVIEGHTPARACVQALLMRPGIDVEVAVVAAL